MTAGCLGLWDSVSNTAGTARRGGETGGGNGRATRTGFCGGAADAGTVQKPVVAPFWGMAASHPKSPPMSGGGLFSPYRAVGLVCSDVPPFLNTLGSEHFLVTPVDKSFHVLSGANLATRIVSPQVKKRIRCGNSCPLPLIMCVCVTCVCVLIPRQGCGVPEGVDIHSVWRQRCRVVPCCTSVWLRCT